MDRYKNSIVYPIIAVLSVVWAATFAGTLVDWVEFFAGRGGSVEFSLRVAGAYAAGLIFLILCVAFLLGQRRERPRQILLTALAIECLLLIAIWLFDSTEFTDEESATRFVTAMVLVLAAAAALLNLLSFGQTSDQHKLAGAFWLLMAMAFLAGGIDEYFAVHESIGHALAPFTQSAGLPRQFFQDGVTIMYVVGAAFFIFVFLRPFRQEMLRKGQIAGKVLIAGVMTYALAVANDSLDTTVQGWLPMSGAYATMNFTEEVLELTAAVLFLCACAIAVVERRPQLFQSKAPAASAIHRAEKLAISTAASLFVICLLIPIIFRFTIPGNPYSFTSSQEFTVSVWADASDGLNRIDEILFVPNLGLLVGNEGTGEVLLFDNAGLAETFIDELDSPDGLTHHGNSIYVTDDIAGHVYEYSRSGQLRRSSDRWTSPEGIAVDSQGKVYVADMRMGLVAETRFSSSSPVATRLDGLMSPEQLAVDDSGNLYIADERARAIFVLGADGRVHRFSDASNTIGIPESLHFHDGYLYVVDSANAAIHRFDDAGRRSQLLSFDFKPELSGIAFDTAGSMYLAITSETPGENLILQLVPASDQTTSN